MNREALKQLAALNIDCQAAQRIGNKVFTGIYVPQDLIDLQACMSDILSEANAIIAAIPISDGI